MIEGCLGAKLPFHTDQHEGQLTLHKPLQHSFVVLDQTPDHTKGRGFNEPSKSKKLKVNQI